MALETATFISGLDAANPTAVDALAGADDHLRLIKSTIKTSFPNVTGAMTVSHTLLNGFDGRLTGLEGRADSLEANVVNAATFQYVLGASGWSVQSAGANLEFIKGGETKMRLDSDGNLTVIGNVTAFGAI